VATRAIAFENRPDKNGDDPNSNDGSSAVDMRSVLLKTKLSEYIWPAAKPSWSPTGITLSPNLVHLRQAAAHRFRMRRCRSCLDLLPLAAEQRKWQGLPLVGPGCE
jgi:hypothetical protein